MENLEPGRDYNNVYFMVIDAKEHSKIVKYNPADKVDKAMDEFENIVFKAVNDIKAKTRCAVAMAWGWQGDGGLFVFYDEQESRARETALESAKEILAEVKPLNDRLSRFEITGEIHIRLAIHKGNIRYREKPGSIHSKDLNLISHVLKVVPYDTIAISKDVYDIIGTLQKDFTEVKSNFEDLKFYLFSKSRSIDEILNEWERNLLFLGVKGIQSDVPINELGLVGVFSQRALTYEYVYLIKDAKKCIWALGVALGGFQSNHRENILLELASKGVEIRLLAADPKVQIKIDGKQFSFPSWCDFTTGNGNYYQYSLGSLMKMVQKINKKLEEDQSPRKKFVELKFYKVIPSCAMLRVDSTIYYSPYFARRPGLKSFTLKLTEGRLYDQCIQHFETIWNNAEYSRVTCPIINLGEVT
jgi:hypothetical protein